MTQVNVSTTVGARQWGKMSATVGGGGMSATVGGNVRDSGGMSATMGKLNMV